MGAGAHCKVLLQRWGARAHCIRAAPEQTCRPRHHAKITKLLPQSKDERQRPGSLLGATGVSTQPLCSPGKALDQTDKKPEVLQDGAESCSVPCAVLQDFSGPNISQCWLGWPYQRLRRC